MESSSSPIARFAFELLHLRRVKNEGSRLLGVPCPDSIAEHSLIVAQLAFILAKMEGANAEKSATMGLWHDLAEARIGDIHKVGARYLSWRKGAEERVVRDQTDPLPFGEAIRDLWTACEEREGIEGTIAKDADYLYYALVGKEYLERGYTDAQVWIDNVGQILKTSSAKSLFEAIVSGRTTDWWRETGLQYIPEIGQS